jgi:peptidyl-prolyl cis-trans isomerase D
MMRQMRQNTKIIMLVTALAFVALMVFEWGMDASGRSAGADLGRVGSTSVSVFEWQEIRRQIFEDVQRSQAEPVSAAQSRQIDDQAWDQVVNQILIRMELERRGIRVSDDEIRLAARFAPPPELRNDPAFQTDGMFDPARYQSFLEQASLDPTFLGQLEAYYRDVIPRSKLLRQVSSGIFVSDARLWQEFRDQNEQVEIRFISFEAPTWIPDADASISSAEVDQFYRNNPSLFDAIPGAEVRYTWISSEPVAADSVAAFERALAARAEIESGTPFAELARVESDDLVSGRNGGSLGRFGRGQMVAPFEEVAFALPVGQISEPVQTDFGWHILEVLDRDEDSVEARHILFSFAPSGDRELALLSLADSLEAMGRNRSLTEAAAALGLPTAEAEISEGFAFLPSVGVASEGQDWVFEESEGAGSVSPVFETSSGFYMLEVVAMRSGGVQPLADVRDQVEAILRSQKKTALAVERAEGLAGQLRSGALTLEAIAEREGLEVQEPLPFNRSAFVPGMGSVNAAVGAAFGTPVGSVAPAVAVDNRVYLMEVLSRQEADRTLFDITKSAFRAQVVNQLRQQRLELWLEGLRENTRIVDRRAEYFRAAELAAENPRLPAFF